MEYPNGIIYLSDDDKNVVDIITALIDSAGYQLKLVPDRETFIELYDELQPSCLVMDVRLPSMSTLTFQEHLRTKHIHIPIIFITRYADVHTAVQAMKSGAVDFLIKPLNSQLLAESIYRALQIDMQRIIKYKRMADVRAKASILTPREREVMKLMVAGKLSKMIADTLNISVNTVETHRAKVMKKMQARSLAELVTMALTSGLVNIVESDCL